MTDKFIGYFRPKVAPFPPVGQTETPNRLTDIHAEENEENDEESKDNGNEIDDEVEKHFEFMKIHIKHEQK